MYFLSLLRATESVREASGVGRGRSVGRLVDRSVGRRSFVQLSVAVSFSSGGSEKVMPIQSSFRRIVIRVNFANLGGIFFLYLIVAYVYT